jgi:glycerol-3-phosphate acyltransferase PlsX
VGFKGALGLGYEMARNRVMDKIAEGMRRFPTLGNAAAVPVTVTVTVTAAAEPEARPA